MIGDARELFPLDPYVAHLNHGSFGSVPHIVRQHRRRLQDEHDANPMRLVTGDLWTRVAAARDQAATFLGAEPGICALVNNATYGAALALNTLDLVPGDEIVVTDHGYHAVSLAVEDLSRRKGIKIVEASVDLEASVPSTVDAIAGRISERTKLVIVDEISSPTARLHPIREIVAAVRQSGVPILIDAAHTPGMLPRPLSGVDPDFWVGNLHKWAFAPGGTALFRASAHWKDRLNPLVVSHGHTLGFPHNIEQQGTHDYTSWLAAPTGLTLFDRYGQREIQQHNASLAAHGQRVIGAALGLTSAELPDPGEGISMRVIPLPEDLVTDSESGFALRQRIADELATEVAINYWRGRGLLRVSAQIYNRPEEYERLAESLPSLLRRP